MEQAQQTLANAPGRIAVAKTERDEAAVEHAKRAAILRTVPSLEVTSSIPAVSQRMVPGPPAEGLAILWQKDGAEHRVTYFTAGAR